MLKKIALLLGVLLLTACLSPVSTPQKSTYVLNTTPPLCHASQVKKEVLLVSMPRLDAIMNNNKMIYLDGQHQMGYFAAHRWAAPPNEMFFTLLLNTLQQQGGFRVVVSAPYHRQSDLQLNIVNLSVVQDFTVHPSVVRVKMNASLNSLKQPASLKAGAIEATVAAQADTPEAGVAAANQAVAQCLTQLVMFVNE